ncbi:hypothetical protein FA13DRAFT_1730028 [Coprinellus micaceus]|uniref:Uncharacterized protein n=1 Tax=Coprinellus micaceus TaxID=71717 RepID=A0A4Y7TIC0_COPMI|nr:hypothetical protein FA13DRAFT_1730028 [Coprinellus micaceus]
MCICHAVAIPGTRPRLCSPPMRRNGPHVGTSTTFPSQRIVTGPDAVSWPWIQYTIGYSAHRRVPVKTGKITIGQVEGHSVQMPSFIRRAEADG